MLSLYISPSHKSLRGGQSCQGNFPPNTSSPLKSLNQKDMNCLTFWLLVLKFFFLPPHPRPQFWILIFWHLCSQHILNYLQPPSGLFLFLFFSFLLFKKEEINFLLLWSFFFFNFSHFFNYMFTIFLFF